MVYVTVHHLPTLHYFHIGELILHQYTACMRKLMFLKKQRSARSFTQHSSLVVQTFVF